MGRKKKFKRWFTAKVSFVMLVRSSAVSFFKNVVSRLASESSSNIISISSECSDDGVVRHDKVMPFFRQHSRSIVRNSWNFSAHSACRVNLLIMEQRANFSSAIFVRSNDLVVVLNKQLAGSWM